MTALLAAACDPAPRAGTAPPGAADTAEARPAANGRHSAPTIALTIDDLPWVGQLRAGETREDGLHSLITELSSRGVPAIGFANCDRAGPGAPALRSWLDAGLELGNHSALHLDLNDAPLGQWLDDVRSCHEMLRDLTGESEIWFRFPYLHQGPTTERQGAALTLLEELDSPIAHVTIDTSDWLLAVAYGEAIMEGDSARAAGVAAAFVDHVIRTTGHYQRVAHEKAGRDVPHVLLLHANLLVADHIGTVLDSLSTRHGFRFVGIRAAQRDSIYDRPDEYTGPDGLSWLYRMSPGTPGMAAWDDAEAGRLRERWR